MNRSSAQGCFLKNSIIVASLCGGLGEDKGESGGLTSVQNLSYNIVMHNGKEDVHVQRKAHSGYSAKS